MNESTIGCELVGFDSAVFQIHAATQALYLGQKPSMLGTIDLYGLENLGQVLEGRSEQYRSSRPEITAADPHASAAPASKNLTHWPFLIKSSSAFTRA